MNLGFDLSMGLQQKLSFKMLQSLKLLQETTLQIEQRIQQELSLNPLLEVAEEISLDDREDTPAGVTDESGEFTPDSDKIDAASALEDGFQYSYDSFAGKNSADDQEIRDYIESIQTYNKDLEEHLLEQIEDLFLKEKEREAAEFIVSSLDNRGYLEIPLEEVGRILSIPMETVMRALERVQELEPAGVAARDLRECLMLQLMRKGKNISYAMEILDVHWDLFEKLKIPSLAEALEISLSEVEDAIGEIRELDPKPGLQYLQENQEGIVPDLIVAVEEGELVVAINDHNLPDLRINRGYSNLLLQRGKQMREMKTFLKEKENSAKWLISALEQRRTTMLRVMHAIIEKQEDFFKKGPPNLNPLKLQEIADMVEMHVSTISRVTSNKYVQTPFGLFELKYFFTEALGKDEDGEDISTVKIKNRLKEIIEMEDRKKPLSDQALSDMMTKEGFALARRTVAKYREQLGIPTARMRKTYA